MDQQEGNSRKRIVIITGVILLLVVVGVLAWLLLGDKSGSLPGRVGDLFGNVETDAPRPRGDAYQPNWGSGGGGPDTGTTAGTAPLLRKISSHPSVGQTEYLTESGSHRIRYMEPEKGNIFDVSLSGNNEERVTNTTVPRVHEAFFGTNGRTVVVRYLDAFDTIKTQIRDLVMSATSSGVDVPGALSEGQFLVDNISDVALSPDGKSLFYLVQNEKNVSKGQILDLGSRVGVPVFEFPFSEWLPEILNNNNLRFTTKSSGLADGYSYAYNKDSKRLRRVIDATKGLTTNYSPSGKKALFSSYTPNGIGLSYIADPAEEFGDYMVFDFSTLAEKCTWSSNETIVYCGADSTLNRQLMPDTWYKGLYSFDDSIWSFDFSKGVSTMLASPRDIVGESIDVVEPFVTQDGSTLIFKNNRDGLLWALTLPQETKELETIENAPELSPEEAKDAAGSLPGTTGR